VTVGVPFVAVITSGEAVDAPEWKESAAMVAEIEQFPEVANIFTTPAVTEQAAPVTV
jgi:hypothetical protein